jgi:hypothetical protein
VLEYWSIGVLRFLRIVPDERGIRSAIWAKTPTGWSCCENCVWRMWLAKTVHGLTKSSGSIVNGSKPCSTHSNDFRRNSFVTELTSNKQIKSRESGPVGTIEGSQAIYCLERIHEKIRPLGYGTIWSALRPLTPECERTASRRSDHTLRDGSVVANFPGNKLPGYPHSVPTGPVRYAIPTDALPPPKTANS